MATFGSGAEFELSTETINRPDVSPPTICKSRWTLPVYGWDPPTLNDCHQ